uniref:Thioredoxin domain protein n=1 Tax=Ochrobactrum phage ORM_20 TaxID=2985243 RepID=A0A9N6ZG77_9VIRU|nr:thioredoxin domain protein [Ochrobactrum phage ORM_20]
MKIDIYTTSGCVYCARAKAVLDCLRHPYTVKPVEGEDKKKFMDDLQAQFKIKDSERTFPKIFIDGRLILGFDDLKKEVIRGNIKRA